MVVAVPITEDFINVSFFTIYYAWISYAFKSYIDNYFTHYQERRWRLKLQKTSLRLPLKKKREKKRRIFFFPTDTPCAGGKSPRFYPYIAPNLREYKQMKEV